MVSHPSWSKSYAEAVDEVNAIERLFLGDDAIDIPRRLNPSRTVGKYIYKPPAIFELRPGTYFQ